jgi:hypothetical protein
MQIPREEQEQALATFVHAGEEMRSLRNHEWQVIYYAVSAYAALAAAPLLVNSDSWLYSWRTLLSLFAFVLVWLVALQAGRMLWYIKDQRNAEGARLEETLNHLRLMGEILKHRPKKRSERPWWVSFGRRDREQAPRPGGSPDSPGAGEGSQGVASGSAVSTGLGLVVLIGAALASVIILSRIPYLPGIVACVGRLSN